MWVGAQLVEWWQGQAGSDLPNMIFFQQINDFMDDEITEFAGNLLGRMAALVGGVVLALLTLWIIIRGYRITTGQSRESMMSLVTHSLRAVLIIGVATGAGAGAGSIYGAVTNGLTEQVNEVVTGPGGSTYGDIDKALAIMQAGVEVIDSVDTGEDAITNDRKERALWFTGVGLGGPAIMAGAMLLLNKIAIALFVGLGPLFILCLLFEQTKPLFSKWLFYGIGTLFSMALLSVMVTLALDMVIAVGLAFWVSSWVLGADQQSLTAMAMQQGGLGLIMSVLIISAPPMAAAFFQGVMGHFSPHTPFGNQVPLASAHPPNQPGYSGYSPPPQANTSPMPNMLPTRSINPVQPLAGSPSGQRGMAQ